MKKIKDVDALLNTSLREFEKQLNAKITAAQEHFERDLGKQVAEIVSDITSKIGNETLANGLNAGIGSIATDLLGGGGVNVRNVANSVATAFAPAVSDFFKQSSSQMADDFSGFLGLSSRNN